MIADLALTKAYRFLESEKASHWFEKSANDWFPIGNLVARAKVLGYSGMNIPNLAGIKGEPDEKNVLKKIVNSSAIFERIFGLVPADEANYWTERMAGSYTQSR